MAWTTPQAAGNRVTLDDVVLVTLSGAIDAGDLIVCWGHCNTGDPPATPVSDNVFGTWPNDGVTGKNCELVVSGMGGASSGRLYMAWMIAPSSAPSGIVVTVLGNVGASRVHAGVRVLGPPSGSIAKRASIATDGGGTGSTTPTTGNASPAAEAGDVLVGGFVEVSGNVSPWTANSPYTTGLGIVAPSQYLFEEYDLNAAGGEQSASCTMSLSAQWLAAFASFSATAPGPPTTWDILDSAPITLAQDFDAPHAAWNNFADVAPFELATPFTTVPAPWTDAYWGGPTSIHMPASTTYQLAASGAPASSGAATLLQTMVLAATGAAASTGAAVLARVWAAALAATGAQVASGAAVLARVWAAALAATGAQAATGAAVLAQTMVLAATGARAATGSADLGRV